MGVSVKYICINNDKVLEIPKSKIKRGKMLKPELANQTVKMIELIYETIDRKPGRIIRMNIDEVSFDNEGIYDIDDDSVSEKTRVKLEYALTDFFPESPLPIPLAPIILTESEIELLKAYFNKKYPLLLTNSPNVIEESIRKAKENYQMQIEKMKRSHKSK